MPSSTAFVGSLSYKRLFPRFYHHHHAYPFLPEPARAPSAPFVVESCLGVEVPDVFIGLDAPGGVEEGEAESLELTSRKW